MKRVAVSTIVEKIKGSRGQFFAVLFKKRTNGQLRWMNCKLNQDDLAAQLTKKLIPVYDTVAKDYRNISIEGIVLASIGKETYRVR